MVRKVHAATRENGKCYSPFRNELTVAHLETQCVQPGEIRSGGVCDSWWRTCDGPIPGLVDCKAKRISIDIRSEQSYRRVCIDEDENGLGISNGRMVSGYWRQAESKSPEILHIITSRGAAWCGYSEGEGRGFTSHSAAR